MYRIEDKVAAVKNVQRYLAMNESGVYDDETRDKVISFQSQASINETGIVDYETFIELRKRFYDEKNAILASKSTQNVKFPILPGDSGAEILRLNSALGEVLSNYTYTDLLPRGSYYNVYTSLAVRRIRAIFGYPEEDNVDEELFLRIERERLTHI